MRRLGWLVLVAALATACSGCGDAPAPEPSGPWPPPSVLALDEPTLPPIDAEPVRAVVLDFVSYLLDEIDYALRTTFPDNILRHGTDGWGRRCEVCDEVVELADTAQDERQRYEFDDWGGYPLLAGEVAPQEPDDPATYWRIRLMLRQPEMRVLDDRGEVVDTTPARDRETVLVLGVARGEWRIFAWDIVGSLAAA
jgi:hypothetical protein